MRKDEPYPIRVFLVDASALTLTLLKRALAPVTAIQVVGETQKPEEVLALVAKQEPHVVCVGLNLPDAGGRTVVQSIMERLPRAILVVGAALREGDEKTVFHMFEAGALDLFLESSAWRTEGGAPFSQALAKKIRLLACMDNLPAYATQAQSLRTCTSVPLNALPAVNMVVIGAGLGGANALREILATLPVDFPVAILCIVHIHPTLRPFMKRWLARVTPMPVQEATHGEVPMPGSVYLPPEGHHLLVDALGRLATSKTPVTRLLSYDDAVTPSIAVAMESAASHFAPVVVGVLLSGTGEDGARGLESIASSGGYTLALDESSAMAFDLPARLLEMGAVRHLLPCSVMGRALLTLTGQSDAYIPCGPESHTSTSDGLPDAQALADPKVRRNVVHKIKQAKAPPTTEWEEGEGILIVEDSPTQALKLRKFLQASGFSVAVAKDGLQGLEMTKSLHPRLVLSDISMPNMDGFELCRILKGDPLLKSIPVVLLTALTNPEEILEGLSVGADNYLTKPWEEAFLLERIRELLVVNLGQEKLEEALQITFLGRSYTITSSRRQVLDLLMTTYQKAVKQNKTLMDNHLELKMLNSRLVSQTTHLEIANQNLQKEIAEREKVEKAQTRTLQALEEANQELNDFAYIVAHDLKAPFRAIGSLTSWLFADYADKLGVDGQELVHLLNGRADRLNALIDALLQYVRVSRVNETLQDVDLNRLVTLMIRELNPPEEMEVVLETPLPTIRFEPKRAEQLFYSLLDNALRFMDKSLGIVRVALVSEAGDWWQFSVTDNGPGIHASHFEKIFGIFQTLQARDERDTSGMGLALARKIVSKFGGRIWVTSKIGEGSTFCFTLPKKPEKI